MGSPLCARGGISRQGSRPRPARQPIRLTAMCAGFRRATASARPRAWASMPARPSETAQILRGRGAAIGRGSDPLDLGDLVGLAAAGGHDLHDVARLLADDRPRDRRGDRDAAALHVGLVLAHDLVAGLLLGVLVDHRDGGAELHLAARQLGDVDHLGPRHAVFDVGDLAFDPALALLGRVILGVLGEIAVRARLGDRRNHGGPLDRLQTLQFFVQGLVALDGHRNFFHRDSRFALVIPTPAAGECDPGAKKLGLCAAKIKGGAGEAAYRGGARDRRPPPIRPAPRQSGAVALPVPGPQECAMAAKRGITLYHSPGSRAFTASWMLEESGVAFDVRTVDIRKGEQKAAAYLKLNPAGKVPTLTDGEVVVSENPAIAIYLADRYSYGTLAPRIEDRDRRAYLKWMVYATAVVDPVASLHAQKIDLPGSDVGFGAFDDMVHALTTTLASRKWLLGDRFSAADVVLGGTVSRLFYQKVLPEHPVLVEYNARLTQREAYHRAADATWPAHLYPTF